MRAEFLRTFCDAVLDEWHERNALAFQFEVGVVDPGCPQQARREVAEPIGLLIDQD